VDDQPAFALLAPAAANDERLVAGEVADGHGVLAASAFDGIDLMAVDARRDARERRPQRVDRLGSEELCVALDVHLGTGLRPYGARCAEEFHGTATPRKSVGY